MAHALPHTIADMKMFEKKWRRFMLLNSKVYNCLLKFIHWWSKRWKEGCTGVEIQ
jgi:hypothetical protein